MRTSTTKSTDSAENTTQKCAQLLTHVGNTPLVELQRIKPHSGARILAKLELQPGWIGKRPPSLVDDRRC